MLPPAARYGATSTVRALIECGAHINSRNSQDESAIILASRSGIASVIKVLAAANADPNDCDHRNRWTCLIW
jgi:ankyrin repeat protein